MMGRVSASEEMTPDLWRRLVGQHVEARRRTLYRSRRAAAAGSGISEIVWRQIESGRRQLAPGVILAPNPEADTKNAICRRLGWTDDSIDHLLAEREPRLGDPSPEDNGDDPELHAKVDELRRRLDDAVSRLEALEQVGAGVVRSPTRVAREAAVDRTGVPTGHDEAG